MRWCIKSNGDGLQMFLKKNKWMKYIDILKEIYEFKYWSELRINLRMKSEKECRKKRRLSKIIVTQDDLQLVKNKRLEVNFSTKQLLWGKTLNLMMLMLMMMIWGWWRQHFEDKLFNVDLKKHLVDL